jgi:hypothetical protein
MYKMDDDYERFLEELEKGNSSEILDLISEVEKEQIQEQVKEPVQEQVQQQGRSSPEDVVKYIRSLIYQDKKLLNVGHILNRTRDNLALLDYKYKGIRDQIEFLLDQIPYEKLMVEFMQNFSRSEIHLISRLFEMVIEILDKSRLINKFAHLYFIRKEDQNKKRRMENLKYRLMMNEPVKLVISSIDPSEIEYFLTNYLTTDQIKKYFYAPKRQELNRQQLIEIISKNFIYSL